MNKTIAKSLTVLMMIGVFSLVSFAQTSLTLDITNVAHVTGEDKILEAEASVDYTINLKKDTRACVGAIWHNSDVTDLKATFEENEVKTFLQEDTNVDDLACFDITESRSYSINLTNQSEGSGKYTLILHSSIPLTMSNGNAALSGSISGSTQKDFTIRLDKSQKLCFTNNSAENQELQVSFHGAEGDEAVPHQNAVSFPITKTLNLIKVTNSSSGSVNYNFAIKYADDCVSEEPSPTPTPIPEQSPTPIPSPVEEPEIVFNNRVLEDDEKIVVAKGASVSLKAQATDAAQFEWKDEKDVSLSTKQVYTFVPNVSGEFSYNVTIENSGNGSGMRRVRVKVVELDVSVPNIFTPNQDGNNDRLQVSGDGIKSIRFKVYNRLGEVIFETTDWIEGQTIDTNKGWDGFYKGKLQDSGNYTWLLSVTYINDTTVKKTGNVYLKY